jgi:hypothetical protein
MCVCVYVCMCVCVYVCMCVCVYVCMYRCWTQGVDCLPCPNTYWNINNVSEDWCIKEEGDLSGIIRVWMQ